jgi:hypothetical protein
MNAQESFVDGLKFPDLQTNAQALGIRPRNFLRPPLADEAPPADKPTASLIAGQVTAFTAGMSGQDKQDVQYTTLAAQLNSDVVVPPKNQKTMKGMEEWFDNYNLVMSHLGWTRQASNWEKYNAGGAGFTVDKVILEVLAAVASENGAAIAKAAIDAISKLPQNDDRLKLFNSSTLGDSTGKFLLGACSKDKESIALAFGAFAMDFQTRDITVVWFNWKSSNVNIYKDQKVSTFNQDYYVRGGRAALEAKMAGHAETYISSLELAW